MIKVIGQATQRNGSSPSWTLTGICTAASRTGTGTYTITCSKSPEKVIVLISAERGGIGTERLTAVWSGNVITIRNYAGATSSTLGDCWLTVTFLEDIPEETLFLKYGENENRIVVRV